MAYTHHTQKESREERHQALYSLAAEDAVYKASVRDF